MRFAWIGTIILAVTVGMALGATLRVPRSAFAQSQVTLKIQEVEPGTGDYRLHGHVAGFSCLRDPDYGPRALRCFVAITR